MVADFCLQRRTSSHRWNSCPSIHTSCHHCVASKGRDHLLHPHKLKRPHTSYQREKRDSEVGNENKIKWSFWGSICHLQYDSPSNIASIKRAPRCTARAISAARWCGNCSVKSIKAYKRSVKKTVHPASANRPENSTTFFDCKKKCSKHNFEAGFQACMAEAEHST